MPFPLVIIGLLFIKAKKFGVSAIVLLQAELSAKMPRLNRNYKSLGHFLIFPFPFGNFRICSFCNLSIISIINKIKHIMRSSYFPFL